MRDLHVWPKSDRRDDLRCSTTPIDTLPATICAEDTDNAVSSPLSGA